MDGMLIAVLKAGGALVVLGIVSAALLATAARKFHVDVDPKVELVLAALPGSNCGACGNPSCFAVAEGIAAGTLAPATCVAGGQAVVDEIAGIMGSGACEVVAVVSGRHCGGGVHAQRAFEYSGVPSCNAAAKLAGGPLVCAAGCLGFGDCMRACPFDAIAMDERGLPVIDCTACTGCGICVRECPRGQIGLLELVPHEAPIIVRCNAHDKPKPRKDACSRCCIACKKCERACPADAIHVVDLLAIVDYDRCTGCGACIAVCPQSCIDLYGRGYAWDPEEADGKATGARGFPAQPEAAVQEAADPLEA